MTCVFIAGFLMSLSIFGRCPTCECPPMIQDGRLKDASISTSSAERSAPSAIIEAHSAPLQQSSSSRGAASVSTQEPAPPIVHRAVTCDWAYAVYITSCEYALTAAVMLRRLSRATSSTNHCIDFVALHSKDLSLNGSLFNSPGMKVVATDKLRAIGGDPTWTDSLTKLQVLGPALFSYSRVVYLDADSHLRRRPDELFEVELGPLGMAMPPAYWLPEKYHSPNTPFVASTVIVFRPHAKLWHKVQAAIAERLPGDFDMDLLNRVFYKDLTFLHERYAGNTLDMDDSTPPWSHSATVWDRSPLIHFYSWPLPKPWRGSEQVVDNYLKSRKNMTPENKVRFAEMYRAFRHERSEVISLVKCRGA